MIALRRVPILFALLSVVNVSAFGKEPVAAKPGSQGQFLRVQRDAKGSPLTLETSIVRYSNGKEGEEEVTVDLVSAIHVADRSYYEALNKRFQEYEAVLYELVADEGTTPANRPENGDTHPIAAMQDGMKTLLELDHQLAIVDYEQPNFVHADMSPEDFEKAMRDRGESFMTMFFRLALEGMRTQQANSSEADDLKLLFAMISPNRAMALKRVMAGQFAQFGDIASALDGPGGSAIVSDRNAKAIDVLRTTLDGGRKHVCIFYGAAHMPDMHKRLDKEFGLNPVGEEWLVAWDMKPTEQSSEFLELLKKNRAAREKAKAAQSP